MSAIPTLILGLTAALPLTSTPTDDLEAAEAAFRSALQQGDLPGKQAALDLLVALQDPDALPILVTEWGSCTTAYHEAVDEVFKLDVQIERATQLLAVLRLQADRDESLNATITEHEKERGKKFTERETEARKFKRQAEWREVLGDGLTRFFDGLGNKRRSAEKGLWAALEDSVDFSEYEANFEQGIVNLLQEDSGLRERLASVEILGATGGDGAAIQLQKFMAKASARQTKLRRKLPKMKKEVRAMEARMQKEAAANDSRVSNVTTAQYRRVKAQSSAMRRELTMLDYICDEAVTAAGNCLAREEGTVLKKTLDAFDRALSKAKGPARLRTLQIIGRVDAEPVKVRLRERLTTERDAAAIGIVLEDLAALGDTIILPLLIDNYLGDKSWHVRSSAAAALAMLRQKEGIPALIEALETAEGRFRTDIRNALTKLTQKDYRTNVTLWKDWWSKEGEAFVVPDEEAEVAASEQAHEEVGVTFFGISTESQRVIFVFDLSGSMEFSMVSRGLPGVEDRENPRDGEISRLTAAKRDLIKAMGGLRDGALFNLVFYASDVWTWQNQLVEMDNRSRTEALATVDDLTAIGGTNIYGALEEAFVLAGATIGDEWSNPEIDTIFLLTDGIPSVGLSTDPDEILAFVREVNRQAGIVIHTIGLSGAQDAYLLRALAEENGGTYAAR